MSSWRKDGREVDLNEVTCVRCKQTRGGLATPPFPDELGRRIVKNVCQVCWDEWLQRQMQLINHFALDVRKVESREFLLRNIKAFLFGEGEGDEIDTGMIGKI